jgi:lysophospholipase L1-like esterase
MALSNDIRRTVFKSVFLIFRRASLPAMNNFIPMSVADLKLKESSPPDWKTFWAEILAGQLQQDCKNNLKILINGFNYHWFDDGAQTMKDLCEYINENQLPME